MTVEKSARILDITERYLQIVMELGTRDAKSLQILE